jgi:hypothetical protein
MCPQSLYRRNAFGSIEVVRHCMSLLNCLFNLLSRVTVLHVHSYVILTGVKLMICDAGCMVMMGINDVMLTYPISIDLEKKCVDKISPLCYTSTCIAGHLRGMRYLVIIHEVLVAMGFFSYRKESQ